MPKQSLVVILKSVDQKVNVPIILRSFTLINRNSGHPIISIPSLIMFKQEGEIMTTVRCSALVHNHGSEDICVLRYSIVFIKHRKGKSSIRYHSKSTLDGTLILLTKVKTSNLQCKDWRSVNPSMQGFLQVPVINELLHRVSMQPL